MFVNASGRYGIEVAGGVPVKAKVAVQGTRLGELAVGLRLIDEEELVSLVSAGRPEKFGQQLLSLGLLDEAELDRTLDDQLLLQLEWLGDLPADTIYVLYADRTLLRNWGGAERRIDPLAAIWRVAASAESDERFSAMTERIGETELRIHPAARIDRFGFSKELKPILDILRVKPQTCSGLIETGLAPQETIQRAVACLTLSRHIATKDGVWPAGVETDEGPRGGRQTSVVGRRRAFTSSALSALLPGDSSSTVEVPPQAVQVEERRRQLTELAEQCSSLSYYELFDISQDADGGAIQAAFFHAAKRWHPDRLSTELNDLKGSATRIFARMTEAHQVLSSPVQRAEYDRLLEGGEDSEHEQVQKVLRASTAFQKAEIYLRRDDIAGALDHAKRAYKDDPDQAEYAALYGWTLCKALVQSGETDLQESLGLVQRAAKKSPGNHKIRIYLARVLKQVGKLDQAFREFRRVAEEHPNNVEAAREVRLYRMRRSEGEQQPGGLLGRLFKR